jgi:hypothetical protein
MQTELAEIKAQRDELLATLKGLQAAVLERQRAELDLRRLYRERMIERAKQIERQPDWPLH